MPDLTPVLLLQYLALFFAAAFFVACFIYIVWFFLAAVAVGMVNLLQALSEWKLRRKWKAR